MLQFNVQAGKVMVCVSTLYIIEPGDILMLYYKGAFFGYFYVDAEREADGVGRNITFFATTEIGEDAAIPRQEGADNRVVAVIENN